MAWPLITCLVAATAQAQAGAPPPPLELPAPDLPVPELADDAEPTIPEEMRPFAGLLGGGIGGMLGAGGMLTVGAAVAAVVVTAAMLMPLGVPLLVASGVLALGLFALVPGAAGIGASIGMLAALGEADPEQTGHAVVYVASVYIAIAAIVAAVLAIAGAVLLVGAVLGGGGGGAGALRGCDGLANGCGHGCGRGCGRMGPIPSAVSDPKAEDDPNAFLTVNPALGGMAGTAVGALAGGALAGATAYGITSVDPAFPLAATSALVVAGAVGGAMLGAAAGGALGGATGALLVAPE